MVTFELRGMARLSNTAPLRPRCDHSYAPPILLTHTQIETVRCRGTQGYSAI